MAASGAKFRLTDVGVRFGSADALRGVTLDIGAGERVALVGPSGAGKTTFLRLLNGGVRPTSGWVEVDGKTFKSFSQTALRELRSRIGFVHQDHALIPNLRVSQNVLLGRLGHQSFLTALGGFLRPSRKQLSRVHRLLEQVGIPEKIFERTDRLSGGQQQRVAIARALIQDPAVLIADEPVSSVDPARARDAVALLSRMCREEGITLVTSLHNLELARQYFPRLVGLRSGRVLFDRACEEVSEEEFSNLYDLCEAELLADGS